MGSYKKTNKQIVAEFSKETGISDPAVDTFIAMQVKLKPNILSADS